MSVLLTADLHFSDKPRDAYRFEFVPRLLSMIREHGVKFLIVLGDLTEEKDRHRAWLVNKVSDCLEELSDACHVIILRGNHDATDPTCPFFQFSRHFNYDRVLWINEPQILHNPVLGDCCYLPHTNHYERDWKALKKRFKDCSYIFAHATFKGVKVGSAPPLDGIPADVFPRSARVFAGDIHAPVKIGSVEYVGAPYLVDFGDDYEPRVVLLDGGKAVKSIPCEGRQKRLVVVDSVEEVSQALADHAGDVVRVRVRTASADFHDSWATVRDQVEEACRRSGCDLNSVQPIITDSVEASSVGSASSRSARTDTQLMEDYCLRMKASDTVLRTGTKLL